MYKFQQKLLAKVAHTEAVLEMNFDNSFRFTVKTCNDNFQIQYGTWYFLMKLQKLVTMATNIQIWNLSNFSLGQEKILQFEHNSAIL